MEIIDNIKSYLTGTLRYNLYYSKCKFLLSKNIIEQFEFRTKVMNQECFNNGSCVECGCVCTALQMAYKSCDGECYPTFLKRSVWLRFRDGKTIIDGNGDKWKDNSRTLFKNKKIIKKYA